MAKLRVTGKRFSINGMFGITMIAIAIVAVAAIIVAAVVLPMFADVTEHESPDVVAIVAPDEGLISIGADLSQVFVTVKYSDGSTNQVALSELIVTGLDTSAEGVVDGVVLDYGGFKQTVSFNVVPTELKVEYVASTGGRIEGETIQSVTAGADATRVQAIADEGYYFAGWSDGDINASRLDEQVSKSMRLIAVFEKLRYTVVFYYPDGTTAREEIVAYNEAPLRVPRADEHNMELYGYRFTGWDTDFTHITKDTNIYPLYEKYSADFHIEYTTDRSGRALGSSDALSYYENDELATVRLTANADRKFIGWSVYDVDLQSWLSIDPIMPEGRPIRVNTNYPLQFVSTRTGTSEEYVLSFTPDENVDEILVKAHFVYLESEISFTSMNDKVRESFLIDYDTPIGEMFDVEDLTYLETLGYAFKGWYANGGAVNADGTPVLVNNQTTFSQPTELIAYWEKEIFTGVFLKGDNEDPSFTNEEMGYDEELGGRVVTAYYQDSLAGLLTGAFPEAIPVKENYTFKGWYLADADKLPTSRVIDKTFKLESPVSYFVPVFEVNTKDLTVIIEGSGSIYTLLYDAEYDVDVERTISGKIAMPVTEDYRIRIRPSAGYVLNTVDVNGVVVSDDNLAPEGYYDLTISSIIENDFVVRASFNLTSYDVSVSNGTLFTTTGDLIYNVLGGDESLKQSSDEVELTVPVNYGSGLSLEIAPKYGYFISAIFLNGTELTVPREAVYYNLILENVTVNNTIVINYEKFVFHVTLPEDDEMGSISADVNTGGNYSAGDSPTFTAKANEGYYVKRVVANGTIIDPYFSAKGYLVSEVNVNGEAVSGDEGDYRVTSMKITIDGVAQNVEFEVEYAELYYNVTTSYEGIGSVSAPFTIGWGKPFHVIAQTTSGYYVHSAIVNGTETTFDDVQLSREVSSTFANKDYDVKFVFKKTVYNVRFEDADGNSSVSLGDKKVNVSSGEGYTFSGIEHASTVNFTVEAKEGYFINSITVTSNAGSSYSEVVNYSATSHVVTIANIDKGYSVEIVCVAITFDYDLYFINKDTNKVVVNNITIANNGSTDSASYGASIAYGNDLTMDFTLAKGYSVSVENVVIKNKDARDEYYYLPLEGEYSESSTNGYYAIILDKNSSSNVSLNVYDVKTAVEVYVTFTKTESGTNVLEYASEGNGTLSVTDAGLNDVASGDSLTTGLKVIVTASPTTGSVLRSLIVNGKEVTVSDNQYSFLIAGDSYVYAVFSETKFTVSVQGGIEYGVVATDNSMVEVGTSFNIKLTPVEGYYVDSFGIAVEGSGVTYQPLNGVEFKDYVSGVLEYTFPASQVTGNVSITASFAPLKYKLTYSHNESGTLGGVGDEGEIDVHYGETKEIELSAISGHYISEIILNGEVISAQSLIGTPIVSGEYVTGILQVYVTGDTTLEVTFSPMVYTITVNESLGGTTLVKNIKQGTAYLPANEIKLGAGDEVAIKMSADEGYHIEELRINGIVDTKWRVENVSKNDLTEIYYELGTVTGNVTLRVIYAINEYQIKVNVQNQSPNFSGVDVDTNSYGTVTITGYNPNENNLYTGFTHGSNVKFVVTPRTARGYYVAKFEIQYFNEEGVLISNVVSSFNENGGSYIHYGISRDIQAVNVIFKRRAYKYEGFKTVENLGSGHLSTGDVIATFTNPYSSQPVVVENGLYEYGLNYTINVNPGEGYSRTLFTVNGEDRLSSVRNNNYVGTVTGELIVETIFTIDTFEIEMRASNGGNYSIYDIGDTLLWQPGITIPEEPISTATGTVWVNKEGIVVTYGTEINFVATPHNQANGYDESGYMIQNFFVNGRARTIQNENAVMREKEVVVSHVSCEVNFVIHTYNVTVNNFEGGVATLSTSLVEWNESVTIRLVISRGYVMQEVLINGERSSDATNDLEFGGSFTITPIIRNTDVVIVLANKEYDLTFKGDYDKEFKVNEGKDNEKTLTAVSGVIINQNSLIKEEREYYTSDMPQSFKEGVLFFDEDKYSNGEWAYVKRAVFADKLTIVLNVPEGYRITAVSITMDNDGGVVSNLVLSESDLDASDGSGLRTYTIQSMTGNVIVNVEYAIKTYRVEYLHRTGGSYDGSLGNALVSYHDLFTVNMISDDGYYLSSLDINGRTIPTSVVLKDAMRYHYSTDVVGVSGTTKLEINDILVNEQDKITIMPTYEKQRFSVLFFINGLQITNLYQDATLNVSLENNEIIYDATNPTTINQTLQAGYSIKEIVLYNLPYNNTGKVAYQFENEEVASRSYNLFSEKGTTLEVTLDSQILSMMDYHSNDKNVIRVYYSTEKDVHYSRNSMYLVEGVDGTNVGKTVTSLEVPKIYNNACFSLSASYSDFKNSENHDYNTEATYTIKIDANAINKYSFQGFQEKVDGEWVYVVNGVNGITLQSNGQVMRYTMTADREFRAVFFRTYEITVQIHPEYKYTEGSFATSDPTRMKYRQYASITATATYTERGTGVILPNVASTQQILEDTDGVDDASYTYRVLSGARLQLRGNDGLSVNTTRGYSYSVITYNGNLLTQREDAYTVGVDTLEDRLVYAYFNNVMYVSFALETVGSTVGGEGGTVKYAVNGSTVGVSNNSITMSPNQTLTITIEPKASYRFDSVMELLPLAQPDEQGFRQFSSTYTPLVASADGTVEIDYYNDNGAPITGNINNYSGRIGKAVVTINGLNENAIFKIRFWKQVKVTSSIELITDETNDGLPMHGYEIAFTSNSSVAGTYDYNDNLFYDLAFNLDDNIFKGYKRYYQFVGYFINGINSYTQLVQNYPSTFEGDFIINNIDGLSNGVNIAENNTTINGVLYTDYSVEIVAKFIPVYNVVIENEYLDNGNYLNPGPITTTTTMYDEALTQYFKTSVSVEPKLGASVTYNTDTNFQVLGKLNTIDNSNKNSASSTYNTWSDNMVSLNWSGVSASGDNFAFIAWQYYAYDVDTGTFSWKNIPYVDPNSQTNLVTKPSFSFPISCLYSTTYPAFINSNGIASESGFTYNASVYDAGGEYASSFELYAIRIRPLFQKIETLELIKSTALNDASIFLDGKGDVDPKIGGTSRSSGNFNYYTIQTINHASPSGYEFAGWYITENGQGGHQPLLLQATESDYDLVVTKGENDYYLKREVIKDLNGNDTDRSIAYSYNPYNGQINLLMDDSFKIYARYIRIYEISVKVTNVSGISPALQEALPTLNYYKKVGDEWVFQGELSGERLIEIDDARVGTQLKFTLSTNYKHDLNDSTYFNPLYDRFVNVTSVNEDNQNVWDQNGSLDAQNSTIPDLLKAKVVNKDLDSLYAYNEAVKGIEIIVTANAEKTINVNFESYGSLILHNVYVGSSIKLPNAFGEALYEQNTASVELGSDASGNDAYYVKDDGIGDAHSTNGSGDGIIRINDIPISTYAAFDGEDKGDFGNRLIDSSNVLESDNVSIGIDFNGSSITSKVQNVVYYGTKTYEEYVWENYTLETKSVTKTSSYDYPFADGGVVGSAGNGTESNPFKIATIEHLRNINSLYQGNYGSFVYGQESGVVLRVHFIQTADINLNETDNAFDEPIAHSFTAENGVTYSNGFNGIYDGNDKTLYNLQLSLSSALYPENVGIFSKVYRGGVIKDLNIGNSRVYATAENVGVLAGQVFGGTISNVHSVSTGDVNIQLGVTGANFVGGLVGLLAGESDAEGTITNSSLAGYTITATVGGSYLGLGSDFTGGAGGLVGSIGMHGKVSGGNGTYTTSGVYVQTGTGTDATGIGAGGAVGTIQAYNGVEETALESVTVINANLSSEYNKIAIGGVVGAVGANRQISDVKYSATTSMGIRSKSAVEGFVAPNSTASESNYQNYGGGGIAGFNNGSVISASVTSTDNYRITINGSMVGGLVGVNLGSLQNSTVQARLFTTRQKATAYEGGTYGGMVGYNVGTISGGSITGSKTATDDYDSTTAAYEVVTGANEAYVPTSGNNAAMHGDAGADTTNLYIGGVAGYNEGSVTDVTNNSKLMVNRRSNDEKTNTSYVAAIVGSSTNDNISAKGTAYVRYFHYIWVDQNPDVQSPMWAYIGNSSANAGRGTSECTVSATAEYIGGGTSFTPSNIEAGFTWQSEGTNYLSGSASVYFYGVSGSTISICPDWNVSGTIESARGHGAVYSVDCEEHGGSIETLWKSSWNYTGYLRHVAVTSHSY